MMNLAKILCGLSAVFLFSVGCSSGYVEKGGLGGLRAYGFDETKVREGFYIVNYTSNATTTSSKVTEYIERRALEVCQKDGYVEKLITNFTVRPYTIAYGGGVGYYGEAEVECVK